MILAEHVRRVAIGSATAVLSLGYARGGLGMWVVAFAAGAVIWWLAPRLRWDWVPSVALAGYVSAAAAGCWLGLSPAAMLAGLVVALCAWDLDHFAQRLRSVKPDTATRALERRHLERLAFVSGLGASLAAISLAISLKLSFGVLLTLSLLVALGVARTFGWLRRTPE